MKLLPTRTASARTRRAPDDRPAALEALESRELLSGGPQVLTVGDSITWGSPNPDQSYRKELDRAIARAGVDAEFVGSRSDGRGFDSDHYSQPGIRAQVSYRGSKGDWRGSLNDGFRSGGVLRSGEKPDLILLHIGTNSITGDRGSVNTAAWELETLLNTMAERYRRGEFASDVKVLVADVIPGGRAKGSSGGNYRLDTSRLENSRRYNAEIGKVIGKVKDRGFAGRVQRVDLAKIDAGKLDRSAFSGSELRSIDNDGDRWVDWFNGVDEGGSQWGARSNNGAVMSDDLLHPTALGYRVLGQAWFEAVEDSGKLRSDAPDRPTPPSKPAPAPTPTPATPGKVSISGLTTARVGDTYTLKLDDGGRSGSWYVHWDDGNGKWHKGVDEVTHTFKSTSSQRVIRVFHEADGKRIDANRIRVKVSSGSNRAPAPAPRPAPAPAPAPAPPAPKAPAPKAGEVSIAGATTARVGDTYTLSLNDGGRRGSWYVHWDDGNGRWHKGVTQVTHTFKTTSSQRVIRVFHEADGKRINANRIRVEVAPAGSRAPAPRPAPTPSPTPTPGARGDGKVTRDYWTNVGGRRLSDLTGDRAYKNNRPTGTTTLTSLRSGDWNNPRDNVSWGDDYGERISGFLIAPKTGNYRFYVSGDDQASFRLSSNERTSGLRTIARVDGWTSPLEWDKSGTQKSASVYLVAGRSYAFEVLHKEARGGDHVAVGWRTPGQGNGSRPSEVIGSRHLSRYAV